MKRKLEQLYEDIGDPLYDYISESNPELKTAYQIGSNMYKRYKRPYSAAKSKPRFTRRLPRSRGVSSRLKLYALSQHKGPEVKRVDILQSGTGGSQSLTASICTTARRFWLNTPLPGSLDYERTGNKTKGVAVHIKGYIYNNLTSGGGCLEDAGRFLLFYDKFPNAGLPNLGDVIGCTDNIGNTNFTSPTLLRTDQNYERFIILRDEMVVLPSTGVSGANSANQTIQMMPSDRQIDWYVPLKGLTTEYVNITGNYTDLGSGGIFLYFFSGVNATGASPWVFTGNSRYYFTDA